MFKKVTFIQKIFNVEQCVGRQFHATSINLRKPAVVKPLLVRENINETRIEIESMREEILFSKQIYCNSIFIIFLSSHRL